MRNIVFIRVLDGTEVFVPCLAENLSDDIFKVIENKYFDNDDFTSVWEFFIGDTISVQEQNGDLYAKKLIDSNIKDRSVFSLIFELVHSDGKLSLEKESTYSNEISTLRSESFASNYKRHPIIKRWLADN